MENNANALKQGSSHKVTGAGSRLLQGEKLAFEIERTRSRLLEMQSDEYLQSEHRLIKGNSELEVE